MKTYFHLSIIFTIGLVVFSGLNTFGASNSDNDLEEAIGLTDDDLNSKTAQSSTESSAFNVSGLNRNRTRAYLLIDGAQFSGSTDDRFYFPNGQLNFSGDYQIQNDSFITVDAIGNYEAKNKMGSLFINQAGFRSRWNESVQYFIGKERNRRSPGLIISPSDFIFSNMNLPGQREDRKGIWLGRLSYQTINGSVDLFLLPVQKETLEGMPESQQDSLDGAIRGLYQFLGVDVSLLVGRYLGVGRAGFSVQSLVMNKYKVYLELGSQEEISLYNNTKKNYPIQSLLGFGYEGSETFSVRLEYFENGQGLNSDEFNYLMRMRSLRSSQVSGHTVLQTPFLRQKYLITSVSFPEIKKKYNVIISGIKSIEDDSKLGITRFEYIAGDKLLIGLSVTQVQGGVGSQFQYRTFNTQTMADLKYSF